MSADEDSTSPPEFIDPLSAEDTSNKDEDSFEFDLDKEIGDMDLSKDIESDDFSYSFSDDPNAQDLFITVGKPEKHALSMETYISYKVSMKTTRSSFDDCKYSVRRRYQDFVWLRQKLEESHPTHFIPPLPSKMIVKGMVDRFTSEFVHTREIALDSFVKRIAEHPVLSCNEHLKVFLTAKAHEFTQHRKQNSAGYLSRVGGSVKSVAASSKVKTRDSGFTEMASKVIKFKEKMSVVDRVADRLNQEQHELPFELQGYGSTYSMWAEAEQDEIAHLLNGFAKTLEICADSAEELSQNNRHKFMPPLKEYVLYCDSIEQVLRRRDNLQAQRDRLTDELERKKEESENLPKADQSYSIGAMMGKNPAEVQQEKANKLAQNIKELSDKQEKMSDNVDCANANIKADMERWDKNRITDIKKLFTELADSHLHHLSKQMTSWESLIPILKEKKKVSEEQEVEE